MQVHKLLLDFQSENDPYMSPGEINAFDNEYAIKVVNDTHKKFWETNPLLETENILEIKDCDKINDKLACLYLMKTTIVYYCLYLRNFHQDKIHIEGLILNYTNIKNTPHHTPAHTTPTHTTTNPLFLSIIKYNPHYNHT